MSRVRCICIDDRNVVVYFQGDVPISVFLNFANVIGIFFVYQESNPTGCFSMFGVCGRIYMYVTLYLLSDCACVVRFLDSNDVDFVFFSRS